MGTTKQMQKTKTTKTTTKTAITQKQSLDVVQTLIHSGISSLAYTRGFFSTKIFDNQVYDVGRFPTYEEYANGQVAEYTNRKKKAKGETVAVEVLRRNRSNRADKFLNLLEQGAFKALQDGRLQALQVQVLADPDDVSKVLEAYTFTIKYQNEAGAGSSIYALDLGGTDKEAVSVEDTQSAFRRVTREIVRLCNNLPDLPSRRFLNIALFYRDEDMFNDVGFAPSKSGTIAYPSIDDWRKGSLGPYQLDSGFHSASVKVSFLKPLSAPETAGSLAVPSFRIPDTVEFWTNTSKMEDIDTSLLEASIATPSTVVEPDTVRDSRMLPPPQKQFEPQSPTCDGSRNASQNEPNLELPTSESSSPPGVGLSTGTLAESLDTQSSFVPGMKNALQAFNMPEHLTQGDTQTQAPVRPTAPRPRNASALSTLAESANATTLQKLRLKPKVFQKLAMNKAKLRETAQRLAGEAGRGDEGSEVVFCQCGTRGDENETIECSCCRTYQHYFCHGFSGSDDPRAPKDHVCYRCLLGDANDEILQQIGNIALNRLAMGIALKRGLKNPTDLARALGIQTKTAQAVHKYLKTQRFVVPAPDSRKKGFSQTGQALYVAVKQGQDFGSMVRELFDPLLHVEHMYMNTSAISAEAEQQLLRLSSTSVPPAAIPQAAIPPAAIPPATMPPPRKSASPSTELGLDARLSATPFKTPLDPGANHSKRRREDDDVPETPFKRPQPLRLRCVQSQEIINADGLSSPAPPL